MNALKVGRQQIGKIIERLEKRWIYCEQNIKARLTGIFALSDTAAIPEVYR
jgi:hypothetical protein